MNGQMIPYDDVRDSSAICIVASTGNDIDVGDSSKSCNVLMYSWSLIRSFFGNSRGGDSKLSPVVGIIIYINCSSASPTRLWLMLPI
jgi:hypothetical protein